MTGFLIWIGGAAMTLWEPYAWISGRRTVSHARGLWLAAIATWFAAFTAHMVIEHYLNEIKDGATLV